MDELKKTCEEEKDEQQINTAELTDEDASQVAGGYINNPEV